MYKLAAIGAMVAALAVPAGAAGKSIPRPHGVRAQINCAQTVVILPGRSYGSCGGNLWFRLGQDGGLTTGPAFWKHLPMDRPDDHP